MAMNAGLPQHRRHPALLRIKHIASILCICLLLFGIWYLYGSFLYYVAVRNANWTRSCVPSSFVHSKDPTVGIIMSYETEYYAELGKLSEVDKRAYAKRHGYSFFINHDILDVSRKPSWYKVLMAKKYLPQVDWLFYVDADTIIMEHDIPLTAFIDDRYDMLITNDHRGANAGVWLMKNSDWSIRFLDLWYTRGAEEMQRTSLQIDNTIPFGKSGDQDTLEALMEESDHIEHMKILPQCAFNSYPYYRGSWSGVYMKGDFLVHLAGKGKPPIRAKIFEAFQNHQFYHVIDSNKTKTNK